VKLFGPKKNISSRGLSYYERENLVHTLQDLKSVCSPRGKNIYTTDKTIMFNNLVLSEITEQILISVFGEVEYTLSTFEDIDNYNTIFYRHIVGGINYLMQFHFYEDTLLFVNNKISKSFVFNSADRKTIVKKIQEKYIPNIDINFSNGFDLQISGANNNLLYINDSVDFSIIYINNSQVLKDLLRKEKTDPDLDTTFEGII